VARLAYSTGADGFILRSTLRQVRGPATASYGIMAADQPLAQWNNVEVLIRGTGQWSVVRNQRGTSTMLVNWSTSNAIRPGHNTPNELQLAMIPGKGSRPGTLAVTINGLLVAAQIAAWSPAPGGRVGIAASPGAQIVTDGLSVDPLSARHPTVEEHFLDNHGGWFGAYATTPLVANDVLRLQPASGHAWAEATTSGLRVLRGVASYREDVVLGVHPGATASAAGGLVFARSAPAAVKPHARTAAIPVTLAAIVSSSGQLSVVQLTPKQTKVLLFPIASPRIRTGYGLNTLRLQVTRKSGAIHVRISVNGGILANYATTSARLQPASGIVAIGAQSTVTVSALRVYR
jgi:hypothetical protein